MDFKSILSVAKENKVYADQEIPVKRYSTEISAPKKPPKSAVKSAAVREFLAKRQAEEDRKAIEAETRRRELLDKRSEAKHNRKATTMAKRTKDNNFMINWQFSAQLGKDENGEISSLNPYAGTSDGAAGSSKTSSSSLSKSAPPPSKPRLLPAPPVDFHDLLQLASKKQHQPIRLPRIPKKTQPTGDVQLQGRPMTNAEKRQFMEEQARREGRPLATVSLPQKKRARFRLKEGDDPNAEFVPNFNLDSQSLGKSAAPPPTSSRPVAPPTRKDGAAPSKASASSRPSSCPRGQGLADRGSTRLATSQESRRDSRGPASNGSVPSRTEGSHPIPKLKDEGRAAAANKSQSRPERYSASSDRRPSNLPRSGETSKGAATGGGLPRNASRSATVPHQTSSASTSVAPNKSRSLPTSNGGSVRPADRSHTTTGRPHNGAISTKPSSYSKPISQTSNSSGSTRPPPSNGSRSVDRGGSSKPVQNGNKGRDPPRPVQTARVGGSFSASSGKGPSVSGRPLAPISTGARPGETSASVRPTASSGTARAPATGKPSAGRPPVAALSASKAGPSSRATPSVRPQASASKQAPSSSLLQQGTQRRPGEGAGPPPKQFPPKDLAPKQFPPRDLLPKQFPPRDLLPKQFPPRDMMPVQRLGPRGAIRPMKRKVIESDDEYDEEMDDFIDDGPVGDNIDYSQHIREIFGYDRSRYVHESYDDLDRMESSFAQQMKEEAISTKLGIMEDLEDIQREQNEIKRKKIASKRGKRK